MNASAFKFALRTGGRESAPALGGEAMAMGAAPCGDLIRIGLDPHHVHAGRKTGQHRIDPRTPKLIGGRQDILAERDSAIIVGPGEPEHDEGPVFLHDGFPCLDELPEGRPPRQRAERSRSGSDGVALMHRPAAEADAFSALAGKPAAEYREGVVDALEHGAKLLVVQGNALAAGLTRHFVTGAYPADLLLDLVAATGTGDPDFGTFDDTLNHIENSTSSRHAAMRPEASQ